MEVFLKGLGVGFAVAAPVGPIGILCIRRTLADGRAAGLASGLGAAAADTVYGLMVAAGFALSGILMSYATPMRFGGGALIALLGVVSIKSFYASSQMPRAEAITQNGNHPGLFMSFSTTFALTITNPMTILAFVGLIAGLGSSAGESPYAPYWLVFGVFTGSALWWLILVQISLVAKTRVTANATRWLDLVSGLVLLVWGLWIVGSVL